MRHLSNAADLELGMTLGAVGILHAESGAQRTGVQPRGPRRDGDTTWRAGNQRGASAATQSWTAGYVTYGYAFSGDASARRTCGGPGCGDRTSTPATGGSDEPLGSSRQSCTRAASRTKASHGRDGGGKSS